MGTQQAGAPKKTDIIPIPTQTAYMFMDEKTKEIPEIERGCGQKITLIVLCRFLSNKQVMKRRRN